MDEFDQYGDDDDLEEGSKDEGEIVKFVDTAAVIGDGRYGDEKGQRHGVAQAQQDGSAVA